MQIPLLEQEKGNMKKIWIYIFLFLIAGLYVDFRYRYRYNQRYPWPTVCNGDYLQRAFVVQMIVPFRPERESFWFAYGNKHYDYSFYTYEYVDRETGETGVAKIEEGCSTRSYPTFPVGSNGHLIDLRRWF